MRIKPALYLIKLKLIFIVLFINTPVNAVGLGGIITELFVDQEKLKVAVLTCNKDVDLTEAYSCETNFTVNYRGYYRLFLGLYFNKEYEENEQRSFLNLPKEQREIVHNNNLTPFLAKFSISENNRIVMEGEIERDLTPITSIANMKVFELPGDLKLKKVYTLKFEIPRDSNENTVFYERYSRVHLIMRRVGRIWH